MNQKNILRALLLAAAVSLGLAASAVADDSMPAAPVPASGTMGLLGQTYASLTYSYLDLDGPVNADSFNFEHNQSLNTGLDGILSYNWTQTGLFLGDRFNQQTVGGALRAFSTSYTWAKPYVEGGVGYTWTRSAAGGHDNSVVWKAAVGAEFQLAPAFTVTPFVQYLDAPSLPGSGTWSLGAKANYWVNNQWALTVGLDRDDDQNTGFTIGTNFRF